MIRSPEQLYADTQHQSFAFPGDKQSPTSLMVHGFTGTPSELYPLGQQLNRLGWSTACDLLPGFGKHLADLPDVTRHDWLETVRMHWHNVQPSPQPTVLLGYSAGGAIATCVAAEFPPDILVLIAPFTRINHPLGVLIPFAHRIKQNYLPFEDVDFDDPEVRASLSDMVEDGVELDDPAVQDAIRTTIKLPMSSVAELYQIGQQAMKAAASVRCPTLIIQGYDDPVVTKQTTRNFVTQFGGCIQYHEVAGDHHIGHDPAVALDLITHFVQDRL